MAQRVIGGVDVEGWSEADVASFEAAIRDRAEAESALQTAQTARVALENAPAAIIRREQEAAVAAAREAADALEFEKAETKYGRGRVARVRTVEGSILLRAMSLAETDGADLRASNLSTPADRTTVHREALLDTVLYPARADVSARTAKYPALWGVLYAARDRLITGVEEDAAGKAVVSISKPAAR